MSIKFLERSANLSSAARNNLSTRSCWSIHKWNSLTNSASLGEAFANFASASDLGDLGLCELGLDDLSRNSGVIGPAAAFA